MRKKKGGGGGGANWMDTYGDMVTLLLCFFVLLYSMSTISEENWKALVMSFNPDAIPTTTETSGDGGPNADPSDFDGDTAIPNENDPQQKVDNDMESLYEALVAYVEQQQMQNDISVSKGDGKIYVRVNDVLFFNGDDWHLRDESTPVLDNIAAMIDSVYESISDIRVLGFTAQARTDSPNIVDEDRLLSAERSAIALAYIQQRCRVNPARMVSEGYGQWHPISDNTDEDSRSHNRRVEIIISGRDIEAELAGEIQTYQVEDRFDDSSESVNVPS